MKLTAVLLSCAGFMMLHVPAASAQDLDPAILSDGLSCPGTWCGSVDFDATDPISGDTGLVEFILKTSGAGSDPSVVTGDVDMSDGYVLRFEMIDGAPAIFVIPEAVTPFNTSSTPLAAGANQLAETAGAANHFSTPWTPSPGTVGYDSIAGSSDTYNFEAVTPEPASLILMGAGLGLLGLGARRRLRRN